MLMSTLHTKTQYKDIQETNKKHTNDDNEKSFCFKSIMWYEQDGTANEIIMIGNEIYGAYCIQLTWHIFLFSLSLFFLFFDSSKYFLYLNFITFSIKYIPIEFFIFKHFVGSVNWKNLWVSILLLLFTSWWTLWNLWFL